MVEKLAIEIALEGDAEVKQKIDGVAQSFAGATKSISGLGTTGAEALTNAAAAAQKFGASLQDLQKVENIINALSARAKDSSTSFSELAANYDKARQSAGAFVPAAAKVEQAIKSTGNAAAQARSAVNALAQGLNAIGAGTTGRIATAVANIGTRLGGLALAAAAVGGTAAALIKFATAAEQTEKALTQLQAVSSQSFQNLSALANVFAQGGTPLKQFASEFGNLSEKIAAAGEQAAKQQAISKQAEDAAKGLKVAELGAITLDERVKALLETLSQSPQEEQWFKLADIFKNLGSDLERARIGKALGLSPESIATLALGGDKLRAMGEEAKRLGLALDDVDKKNLTGLIASQTQAGALFDALKDKMGALVAPAVASFWQGFTQRLTELIPVFTQIASSIGQIDFSSLGAAAAEFLVILGKIGAGWAGIVSGQVSLKDVLGQMLQQAGEIALDIGVAIGTGIIQGIISSITAGIGAIWEAIKRGLSPSSSAGSEPGGIPQMAGGGLLGGRGTGTSDSNLAWVSRGEHIMPARAVAQPGVLSFLELLRRSDGNLRAVLDGMGRFAFGGMVQRMPAFAAGGLAGGGNHVTIQFPGLPAIGGLRASSDVVDQLHKAAALAQVRSGGRKPSRYS